MQINKIFPGIYEFSFGEREQFEPSKYMLEPSKTEKLNALSDCRLPIDADLIIGEVTGRGALITLPYSNGEEIYGFGLQSGKINQAGCKRLLKTNADAQGNIGNSHSAIPFYVSTKGYGIVLDTMRYTCFSCATSKPHKTYDLSSPKTEEKDDIKVSEADLYSQKSYGGVITAEILTVKGMHGYLFAGNSQSGLDCVADVCRRYVLFSGGGAMPPLWGLGVWYRACGQFNETEVLDMASLLRDENMPVSVLGLEPGWHSHAYSCTYKFDKGRYGNYKNTLKKLRDMNYNVNLWEHVFVHPDSDIYKPLEPYAADYEVWGGIVPDLSIDEARNIYGGYHDNYLLEEGISGFKCDECDGSDFTGGWSYPDHAKFPSGIDGEQMHSMLPMYYQKTLYELFKRRNKRTWGEVRAQHSYSAPYPFILYSDWYEHKDYISMVLNMGFSGIMYSPEIRTADGKADLYRRMLTGIFSPKLEMNIWFMPMPMWKNYNYDGNWKKEILPDSDQLRDDCRRFMNIRTSLAPYLYTAFYKYNTEGIAPVRALQMDYPECRGKENQGYISGISFGDDIIAYPLTANQLEVKLYLPNGIWYCYFTNVKYEGGKEYILKYEIDKIPVFVREGAILPILENVNAVFDGSTLKIKPMVYMSETKTAYGILYTDDFKSFDFEKGFYSIYKFEARNGKLNVSYENNNGYANNNIEILDAEFIG
ncbi:MAG: glycoside hydrolase family 31 protein [Oscillospiraceae bacterium]|nr:glycoside hydrolase family 31 protein [Oscillospiraceae bacterium]